MIRNQEVESPETDRRNLDRFRRAGHRIWVGAGASAITGAGLVFLTRDLALAQSPGEAPTGPGGTPMWMGNLFLIASFMLIFYFLLLRPQQKRQKAAQKMLESLKKGDRVVTTGGIHGTILNVKDDVVVVKIDENVKVDVSKSAVTAVAAEGK